VGEHECPWRTLQAAAAHGGIVAAASPEKPPIAGSEALAW
jgi:hypothetical protein